MRFGGSPCGAHLLAGKGIETVLSVVTAVPGIHAAAALSAGSLGAFEPPQDLALLVIARDKDVEGGNAANRLQHRCEERGIPSIVIVPDRSDFNDDLIAFGIGTLAARIAPLVASTKPRCNGGREAWEWENNHPVMMSHCPTRSHCANPCGVRHSASLRYGDSA